MPACPVCGHTNDSRDQRCGRCGKILTEVTPFQTSIPATRRMGHTMLGIAPVPATSNLHGKPEPVLQNGAIGSGELPAQDFEPFAPVPGTLTGLFPIESPEESQGSTPHEPIPHTLPGLAGLSSKLSASAEPFPAGTTNRSPGAASGQGTVATAAAPSAQHVAPATRADRPPPELAATLSGEPREVNAQQKGQFKGTLMGFANAAIPNAKAQDADSVSKPLPQAFAPPDQEAQQRPGSSTLTGRVEAPSAKPKGQFKGTLLGFSPIVPSSQQQATSSAPKTKTLPLAASPAGGAKSQALPPAAASSEQTDVVQEPQQPLAPQAEQPTSAQGSSPQGGKLKETLLGFAAPFVPATTAPKTLGQLASTLPLEAAAGPHSDKAQPRSSSHQSTILGMASPITPTQPKESGAGAAAELGSPPAAGAHKGTLLGVAMPGIAPMQPGQAKLPPAFEEPRAPYHPLPAPPASAFAAIQSSAPPPAKPPMPHRRLAWFLGVASAFLLLIIVVALGVWWTNVHLEVEVTTTESGVEQLKLACSNCPDGTKASIDSASASFRNHSATIDLARHLVVGPNRLTLQVTRPNRTRGETVSVTVPVEFRVKASIAELALDPPALSVEIETIPGTSFLLEGRAATVGPTGRLKSSVDVSAMLTGQSASVLPLERRLSYEVTREATSTKGSLIVRAGITPLEIFTPGSSHTTQNATFTLSGRTSGQAKLTANGHPISVATDGTFRQDMQLSAPGATVLHIRAQELNQAPRLVNISLERVVSLRQRADELARSLPADYDTIASLADGKPGSQVALRAEAVAVESVGALTRIVGSSSCVRGPCLSSIRYGGLVSLPRGAHFTAIGAASMVTRPNSTTRDLVVDARLVIEDQAH